MAATDAQNIADKLLEAMGVAAIVRIESDEPIFLTIESDDSALLIGKKGESLRSLQHIINSVYKSQFPDGNFVSLDIAGYKKERIEKVQNIAQESADKVKEDGNTIHLKPMNSFERRHVHTLLANDAEIVTESEGEGITRHVVIKKRD